MTVANAFASVANERDEFFFCEFLRFGSIAGLGVDGVPVATAGRGDCFADVAAGTDYQYPCHELLVLRSTFM